MKKGAFSASISFCGDLLIARRIPRKLNHILSIKKFLESHDCCFGNLETTILRKDEGYPELFPGGGYAMASPECLDDLKWLGFNLLNTATNHAMDYSHSGLLKTIENLEKRNVVYAGTGKNLSDAAAAVFFESTNARIALIGVTSSFHDSYAAGPQNSDMIGRPGVSPLKHNALYELDKKHFAMLKELAEVTGINNYHNMGVQTGYLNASENMKFGTFDFVQGKKNAVHTTPNIKDLDRTIGIIKDARIQSDIVVVSIHSHQFLGKDRKASPQFIELFAKSCIDAGADVIVCHGPHLLRGVEIYNNRPIFYSLGNFIFQHEQQFVLPEEFYEKYGTKRQSCNGVGSINEIRNKNGTVGLIASNDEWFSIILSLNVDSQKGIIGKIKPVKISKITGLPELTNDEFPLDEIIKLSKKYNTKFEKQKKCIVFKIPFAKNAATFCRRDKL